MNKIEIGDIKNIKKNKGSISFQDGKNDYSFLVSKSTLTKRFITKSILHKFNVEILKDPLFELEKLLNIRDLEFKSEAKIKQTVFLPLYGRKQTVFEKAGLINGMPVEGQEILMRFIFQFLRIFTAIFRIFFLIEIRLLH